MADKKDGRIIIKGEAARKALLEGAEFAYNAVTPTYGAKGTNVMIEKPFGRPLTTRDGVSVARDTYTSERATNMGTQRVLEAAETTNRIAGDGTTATVALTYNLLHRGALAIAAGIHPMEIKRQFIEDSYKVLEKLDELKKDVKEEQLNEVAAISSGDPLLGTLIAEAIVRVGADGGIITEKAPLDDIEREFVDGYYLQNGFQALQVGKKEIADPFVIVSIRRLSSAADIIDILTNIAKIKGLQPGNIPRVLFIGNIEDAAYNTIVENINRGTIDAIVLKTPPMFGEMGKQLLEDVAIYANCRPFTESAGIRNFDTSYIGNINKIVASKTESTLFADNSTEAIITRVQEIRDQIKTETVDAISEKLKDRVAKLEGKIALFRIGGVTDSVKEEVEFRVEDAIHATRAAYTGGIVAGGGVTLLELSKLDISSYYCQALRDTFMRLIENAGMPPEVKLEQALKVEPGFGFDLKHTDELLIDMIKNGIIDPALVVREIIKNATASATDMLTTETLIIFEDKKA